jgi:hypothetical protein
MRIGVISPNILNNIPAYNAMYEDPLQPRPFEALAKRACLLFDKIYLTENLELTYEIVGSGPAVYDDDQNCGTLQYLTKKGVIFVPQDLGYASGAALLRENIRGTTATIHRELLKVGNPSNNCGPGEYTYVGQPDIGDTEAHDGNHPRSDRGWNDPGIEIKKENMNPFFFDECGDVAPIRHGGCGDRRAPL